MLTYPNISSEKQSSFRQAVSSQGLKPLSFSIYDSEIKAIASETLKHWQDENETGGTLHGLTTRSGEFVIMLATPPGKNAFHSKYRFQMDLGSLIMSDRHLKDHYKIDHLGDWHDHVIDLPHPSCDDIDNTNRISRKNNYDRYIQLIITISQRGKGKFLKLNAYIYTNAKHGSPHPCRINFLPGLSPLRLALEHEGNILGITEKYKLNDTELTILPSAQNTASSPTASRQPIQEKLRKRIEKQLVKLPSGVLERVELEYFKGFIIVTVPIRSSSDCLYIAYAEECPFEISSVYLGRHGRNSPVDVTAQALKFGPYTHIQTIWSRFTRFLELKNNPWS